MSGSEIGRKERKGRKLNSEVNHEKHETHKNRFRTLS